MKFNGDVIHFIKFNENIKVVRTIRPPHLMCLKVHNLINNELPIFCDKKTEDLFSLTSMNIENGIDRIIVSVVKSVKALHSLGIVNGNLKPSNIMFNKTNEVIVTDYCINMIRNVNNLSASCYRYFSPEQLFNYEVTYATDIYNIGLVIYYLTSSCDMYNGITKREIMTQIVNGVEIEYRSIDKYIKIVQNTVVYQSKDRLRLNEILEEFPGIFIYIIIIIV